MLATIAILPAPPRLSADSFAFTVSGHGLFVISCEATRLIGNRKNHDGALPLAHVPEIMLWRTTAASRQIHFAVSSAPVLQFHRRPGLKFSRRLLERLVQSYGHDTLVVVLLIVNFRNIRGD